LATYYSIPHWHAARSLRPTSELAEGLAAAIAEQTKPELAR
jgi:hypothetical protein